MNHPLTFLLLRLGIGTSLLGHGLVRLPKLHRFSDWMVTSFQKSILPQVLVLPFSYVLPVAEFSIGLLLIACLFTRLSALAGSGIMILLIFGCCITEEWSGIPSQLIHLMLLAYLISCNGQNHFSLDRLFGNTQLQNHNS